MIVTLADFIDRVRSLSDISEAYDLFEDESTDFVRDAVICHSDPDSPEPFRNAMHNLGFTDY